MDKIRTPLFLLLVVLAVTTALAAQTGLAGTWHAQRAPVSWTAVLRSAGAKLVGAVTSCASLVRVAIADGTIEGDRITFTCRSPNGQRTLMFAGTIAGDEITFTWDMQVRPGGDAFATDPMFGASRPHRFTAKRGADAPGPVKEIADRARIEPALTFDRILRPEREPHNWLTYSGNLLGHRYSPLRHVTTSNVKDLELAWIRQIESPGWFEATPLVVDGVLYTVRTNDVYALDASTGQVHWRYPYTPAPKAYATGGGGRPNRGLAILGNTLFLGTLDAHLLAVDAMRGALLWNTTVADAHDPLCQGGPCYVITHAPLVVKDKVIVGVAGGEGRTRGFLAAFDAATGTEAWRFYTIPGAGEPGNDTWSGDSWKVGGAPVWNTGAYDADLNLTYWGIGNPFPLDGSTRLGDNLYSKSVVALDADTGKLRWHYQFTPHDVGDWDSTQVPVLTDLRWQGQPRKVMLWANRNGLMYVLDRTTGQFLMGKPFVEVNWMTGFDQTGRPIRAPDRVATDANPVKPSGGNAKTWQPDSYSPSTGLFYVAASERANPGSDSRVGRAGGYGAIRAFDMTTGTRAWEFRVDDALFWRGVLTTASDLLFTGTAGLYPDTDWAAARRTGDYFHALDARTGEALWKFGLTAAIQSPPMTYAVGGKQFIAVAAGDTLFAFALRP